MIDLKKLAFHFLSVGLFIELLLSFERTAYCEGKVKDFFNFHPSFSKKFGKGLSVAALDPFLQEVISIMPKAYVETIPWPIQIKFKTMGKEPALPDPCQVSMVLAESRIRSRQVRLDERLVHQILKGPTNSTSFGCGHKNYYTFAKAILAHELSHFYDHKTKISRNKQFLQLTGWYKKGWLVRTRKQANHLTERSPDAYEFKKPKETFAVNTEFFFLDPEFKCRKPSLYRFLSKAFQHQPFPEFSCTLNTHVQITPDLLSGSHGIDLRSIDPERIYQVHYLLAAKGESFSSRWGHSMLRLVVCNKNRKEVGPDCLRDISDHLVLSYRANLTDFVPGYWNGLTGKYPSQLFILTLANIVEEYTKDELRDLISIPIQLTQEQKNEIVYRTLESYWSYKGKYRFLSNNCATETCDLLKGASDLEEGPHLKSIYAYSPLGLFKGLIKKHAFQTEGLIDKQGKILDPKGAEQASYLFKSKKEQLEASFFTLRNYSAKFRISLLDYLLKSTAVSRKALFDEILSLAKLTPKEKKTIAASFFVLESQALRMNQRALLKKAFKEIIEEKKESIISLDTINELKTMADPLNYLKGGYGIPTLEEWSQLTKELEQEIEKFSSLFSQESLYKPYLVRYQKELDNLNHTVQNMKEFKADMLKWHIAQSKKAPG